ncbi:MAG TPA: hypothetical protein VK146_05090 [Tabrizicola sp.]|nr:hypothetical protein [Tabrizicola sp.]
MPPEYIGKVRFGAGTGCGCESSGVRIGRWGKGHFGIRIDAYSHQIYWGDQYKRWLTMMAEDLSGPGPYHAGGGPTGTRNRSRLTGRMVGTAYNSGIGDSPFFPFVESFTDTETVMKHAADDTRGRIAFTDEYTFALLGSDLANLMAEPTALLSTVPWNSITTFARLENVGGEEGWDTYGDLSAFTGAVTSTVDTTPVPRLDPSHFGWAAGNHGVQTEYKNGQGLLREIIQRPWSGPFALKHERWYRNPFTGFDILAEEVVTEYYNLVSGWMVLQSPPPSSWMETEGKGKLCWEIYRIITGATAPSGEPTVNVTGPPMGAPGPGGGC